MAYFGRTPKKPGSVPGAASGFVQQDTERRVQRAVRAVLDDARPQRQARAGTPVRAARAGRAGRSAR